MAEIPFLIKNLALILMVAGIVTLIFKRLQAAAGAGIHHGGIPGFATYALHHVGSRRDGYPDLGRHRCHLHPLLARSRLLVLRKLWKIGASPIIATVVIVFCMMMLGISVGHGFGWGRMDCIFLGGMLTMSSTTIIYKAFDDMRLRTQKFASMVIERADTGRYPGYRDDGDAVGDSERKQS